jgi:opine dehydrogenase
MFPQFHPVEDIRLTSLNNMGAIIHPAITILNSGAISRDIDFHFYCDGVTPAIARVIQKVDEERMRIMKFLGLKTQSLIEWARSVYKCEGENYLDTFHKIKPYQGIKAPQSLQMRYIKEDVPTGLVPLASLGKHLKIPTPAINSLIGLANALFSYDFYKHGRTVEHVGIPRRLLQHEEKLNNFPSLKTEFARFE